MYAFAYIHAHHTYNPQYAFKTPGVRSVRTADNRDLLGTDGHPSTARNGVFHWLPFLYFLVSHTQSARTLLWKWRLYGQLVTTNFNFRVKIFVAVDFRGVWSPGNFLSIEAACPILCYITFILVLWWYPHIFKTINFNNYFISHFISDQSWKRYYTIASLYHYLYTTNPKPKSSPGTGIELLTTVVLEHNKSITKDPLQEDIFKTSLSLLIKQNTRFSTLKKLNKMLVLSHILVSTVCMKTIQLLTTVFHSKSTSDQRATPCITDVYILPTLYNRERMTISSEKWQNGMLKDRCQKSGAAAYTHSITWYLSTPTPSVINDLSESSIFSRDN